VATSGPNLEVAIPTLKSVRDRLFLVATGSALSALTSNDLFPDVVVVTDTSPFAAMHLTTLGSAVGHKMTLLAPITVSPSAVAVARSLCYFSQGELAERCAVFGPRFSVPMLGSVTLTALSLVRALTSAPIILAGMDFAWLQGRSHVRPHLTHSWHHGSATRLCPYETTVVDAVNQHSRIDPQWTQDRALRVYADWFCSSGLRPTDNAFLLSPSPITRNLLPEVSDFEIARLPRAHHIHDQPNSRSTGSAERTRETLKSWRILLMQLSRNHLPTGLALELLKNFAIRELLRWTRNKESEHCGECAIAEAVRQLDRAIDLSHHVAA
jgi:hypothetical protein